MSDLINKDSDSDVDSNSSWTLLTEDAGGDDDRSSKKQDQDVTESVTSGPVQQEKNSEIKENESAADNPEIIPHENEINREDDVESLSSSSSCSVESLSEIETPVNNSKQGCISHDEDLSEKETSHDNDYDDRAEYWEHLCNSDKRQKRKYKKSKAENLTTMTVVGAVLSLAGLSLICMLTPQVGKQFVSPNIQNKIEKNFTKIETPFAKDNDLKVYIDTSNKAIKLIDKVEVLEPYIKKCCNSHVKNIDSKQKTCEKNEKLHDAALANEKPVTYEQFLKENFTKKLDRKPKGKVSTKVNDKIEVVTSEKFPKNNVAKILKTKEILNKKNEKLKQEVESKKDKKIHKETLKDDANVNRISNGKVEKEFEIKKTIDKNNRYLKNNTNKIMGRFISKKIHENQKKNDELPGRAVILNSADGNIFSKIPDELNNFKPMFHSNIKRNEPNFVLVNSKTAKHNRNIRNLKIEPIDKIIGVPNTEENNITDKKIEGDTADQKTEVPKMSTNETSESFNYHTDFIACQLLQDICMLRLTGKLKTDVKAKEKKLKRKLDKKKLRAEKTYVDSNDPENKREQSKSRSKAAVANNVRKTSNIEKLLNQKERFNFKPKLVNNHFVIECKPLQIGNVAPLSNIDLLKELPFHNIRKQKREAIIVKRLGEVANESVLIGRLQRASSNSMSSCVSTAKRMQKDIMNKKLASLLENARKNNEEKLRLLEQMRQENRVKIQKIIRERRERMKKDASLGIYNIPLPKYTEVSEKLKQLKQKPQQGFVIESASSSESEADKCFPKGIENKISCELMTALKMGKKVSDSFRDWTLKKAPTLTCLKNYCNSKVSQISERLTNQSFNQANITSSLNKEELEALKCRKEKHEQLKKFWRAKQEYLDKRIEICKLLKKKLSSRNVTDEDVVKQNFVDGVQLLDSIINDVLKSVKNSKSCINNTTPVETEVKVSSKSVGNIIIESNTRQAEQCNKNTNETVARNPGDLYSWLFEKKAMEIRRKDSTMWNLCKPGHVEKKKEVSKQDPSKAYHDKIIKKHN